MKENHQYICGLLVHFRFYGFIFLIYSTSKIHQIFHAGYKVLKYCMYTVLKRENECSNLDFIYFPPRWQEFHRVVFVCISQEIRDRSMSGSPYFIHISFTFYPYLIQMLSIFYTTFIHILSKFYPYLNTVMFWQVVDKIRMKFW